MKPSECQPMATSISTPQISKKKMQESRLTLFQRYYDISKGKCTPTIDPPPPKRSRTPTTLQPATVKNISVSYYGRKFGENYQELRVFELELSESSHSRMIYNIHRYLLCIHTIPIVLAEHFSSKHPPVPMYSDK